MWAVPVLHELLQEIKGSGECERVLSPSLFNNT